MASKRIMKRGIKKLMMFIQKQTLRIVSIALRRANFSQRENLKSVLLPGALPLGPWTKLLFLKFPQGLGDEEKDPVNMTAFWVASG